MTVLAPLLAITLNLPKDAYGALVMGFLLGTPVVSLLGTVGAALVVGAAAGVLVALVVLPLTIDPDLRRTCDRRGGRRAQRSSAPANAGRIARGRYSACTARGWCGIASSSRVNGWFAKPFETRAGNNT